MADSSGQCADCGYTFRFQLVHNGFNESAYAYCDLCGQTAFLSGWSKQIPPLAGFTTRGPIAASVERWLAPCSCGGHFKAGAEPRCPQCRARLSAVSATKYIEASAPGARQGWRWQQAWDGLYAIVIDDRLVNDPWLPTQASRSEAV